MKLQSLFDLSFKTATYVERGHGKAEVHGYTNYSSQRSGSRTSCNGEILANELMENYYLQTPI